MLGSTRDPTTSRSGTDAVSRAQQSLALFGHPGHRWSIVLHARLAAPLDPGVVAHRLATELARRPALGPVPAVTSLTPGKLPEALRQLAAEPYASGGCALRVALVQAPEPGAVVAAHHGTLDGLGLVALLSLAIGKTVTTSARGVAAPPRRRGEFVVFAARRIGEAIARPPSRIAAPAPQARGAGERLAEREVPVPRGGTGALVAGATRMVIGWNREHRHDTRRIAIAIGASERAGAAPTLEHRGAWMRITTRSGEERQVRDAMRRATPQPVAPASQRLAAAGGLAAALLSRRLGSTLLVSNLGLLSGPPELRAVSFYPVTHGDRAVALGAATIGERTMLTLRAEAGDFDAGSLQRLLGQLERELVGSGH